MLFNEIPTSFKNETNAYLKKIFNNIQKKDNNLSSLNNLLYPSNLKTDHGLEIGGTKHIETLIEYLFLLHIFHRYSKQKNFYYSLIAGGLLGHHTVGSIMPWDDDIDIVVPFSQFKHVKYLWNHTNDRAKKIWDNNWSYKNIKINVYNLIILRLKNKDFFKLKFNCDSILEKHKFQSDIGGLDIISPNCFRQTLSKDLKTVILDDKENYHTAFFCNTETSLLKKDISELMLDQAYPKWKEMKHPRLF